MQNNHTEDKKTIQDFIKEKGEDFKQKYYPWIMGGNGLEIKSFLTSSLQEAYELGKVEMIREVNEKIKEMYLKKPEKDRAYGNGYVKGFNQAVSIVESFLTTSSDTKDDLETNK